MKINFLNFVKDFRNYLISTVVIEYKVIYLFIIFILVSCSHSNRSIICSPPQNIGYGYGKDYGYFPYHNLDEAKLCAQRSNKPLFVLFTGLACLADSKLPWNSLNNADVKQFIKDHYVFTVLYVDDKTLIKDKSTVAHNSIERSIGEQNSYLQNNQFNNNSQPIAYILNGSDTIIFNTGMFFEQDVDYKMLKFLEKGMDSK